MGRFYKTAQAKYVDNKMFQPDINVMASVIGKVDKQIEDQQTAVAGLHDSLKAEGLKVDKPRLQEIINGYSKKIDDMSTEMQSDPLQFRRKSSALKALTQDIKDNWQSGEIAAIQNNKGLADAFTKAHLEKVKAKEGRVTQQDVTDAENMFAEQYAAKGGVNYKGKGKYNQYITENLIPVADMDAIGDAVGKDWKADMQDQGYAYADGQWIKSGSSSKEVADKNVIKQTIQKAIMNKPELLDYYRQQVKWYNESGGKYGTSPEEFVKRVEDTSSIYAEKYGFVKSKSTAGLQENGFVKQAIDHANSREMKALDYEYGKKMKTFESNLKAIAEIGTSSKNTFLTPEQMKDNWKTGHENLGVVQGAIGVPMTDAKGRYNYTAMREKLVSLGKDAVTAEDKKTIANLWQTFNSGAKMINQTSIEASFASATDIMPAEQVVSSKKDWDGAMKDPMQMVGLKQSLSINKKIYPNVSINDVYLDAKTEGGKSKFGLTPTQKRELLETERKDLYNQGSLRPTIRSGVDYNLNGINTSWNTGSLEIEANVSWSKAGISR